MIRKSNCHPGIPRRSNTPGIVGGRIWFVEELDIKFLRTTINEGRTTGRDRGTRLVIHSRPMGAEENCY